MTNDELRLLERELDVEIRCWDAELERAMVVKRFGFRRAWALVSSRLLYAVDITDGRVLVAYATKIIDEYVAANPFPTV